jgi:hypothetical protein
MDTKKEMPWDFWNYNINPILGYRYDPISENKRQRNKHEYKPEDDIKL